MIVYMYYGPTIARNKIILSYNYIMYEKTHTHTRVMNVINNKLFAFKVIRLLTKCNRYFISKINYFYILNRL